MPIQVDITGRPLPGQTSSSEGFNNAGLYGASGVNPSGGLIDPGSGYRGNLGISSAAAGNFGQQAGGQFFGSDQANNAALRAALTNQMQGGNSASAEQLRQGLQQNVAGQQAQAASASPQDAAMAQRRAMMNSAKLGYGMSGQQAQAGIAERNAATQQLSQFQTSQRQQDMQAALGGYGTAVQGYGQANQNPGPNVGGLISGGISSLTGLFSDRRVKKNIQNADEESKRLLEGLKAYRFDYKDERNGKGKGSQFGVMAQDLERAGLKHAVVDTPRGKMVDGARTATSALALTAALARRVSKLEAR